MACLPESGGCERPRVEPFIQHINNSEGASYSFLDCLDIKIRNRPQPELLYVDSKTLNRIVVERKSLVWPLNHAKMHKADHLLAESLFEKLKSLTNDAPYELTLQSSISINTKELLKISDAICNEIIKNFNQVKCGKVIESDQPSPFWSFRKQVPEERDYFESEKGLTIFWPQSPSEFFNSIYELPEKLITQIEKVFKSCEAKFSDYLADRRILLLDPLADLRHLGVDWWNDVFQKIKPSPKISEIWSGIYDWITDIDEGWIFEKLY